MKIAIVGTGYVGLVTGACFAKVGNEVWCVDVNEKKINDLKNGIIPIYEPGLSEIVHKCYRDGNLHFVTDLAECIGEAEMVFSAVGTPPGEDGSADLQYVFAVAERFGELIDHDCVFVTKSTVPVGTARKVAEIIGQKTGDIEPFAFISVASNPEFLKEGSAIQDFMKPDRIVVGVDDEYAEKKFIELYKPFIIDNESKLIITDVPSAEMIKYAANAMLATRISFMNEVASICRKVGADIDSVRRGIGTDTRIGNKFLYAGCGYGGSCFPKDVKALIHTGEENSVPMYLLKAVEKVNEEQKAKPLITLRNEFQGFQGKKILIWGLAFKPETDDIREAPSLVVVGSLLLEGAEVYAYDPVAGENFQNWVNNSGIYQSAKERFHLVSEKLPDVTDIDGIILLTEWNEFRNLNWKAVAEKYPNCRVFYDGRNVYYFHTVETAGIKYFSVSR